MTGTLAGILAASLLGSAHCAAMCGGFVCFYAPESRKLRGHLLYNGGRLAAYVALGAMAGALGAGVAHLGALAGIARGATLVGGAMMIVWGLTGILAAAGVRLRQGSALQRGLQAWIGDALERLRGRSVATRALAMGLLTSLLPCGWLYVFAAAAGTTGKPLDGAVVMLVFWAGTLPAMLAVGFGAQRLFGPLRRRLPVVSAVAVAVIGVLALTGRLAMTVTVPHGH